MVPGLATRWAVGTHATSVTSLFLRRTAWCVVGFSPKLNVGLISKEMVHDSRQQRSGISCRCSDV